MADIDSYSRFMRYLDSFFTKIDIKGWSFARFTDHANSYPDRDRPPKVDLQQSWYSRLDKIANQSPQFSHLSDHALFARQILRSRRKDSKSRASKRSKRARTENGASTGSPCAQYNIVSAGQIITGAISNSILHNNLPNTHPDVNVTEHATRATSPTFSQACHQRSDAPGYESDTSEVPDSQASDAENQTSATDNERAPPDVAERTECIGDADLVWDILYSHPSPRRELVFPSSQRTLREAVNTFLTTSSDEPQCKGAKLLRVGILFPFDISPTSILRQILDRNELIHLQSLFPQVPGINFSESLSDPKCLLELRNYIEYCLPHLKFMFAHYESVADARGEGVIDAFWAIPFDAALLTSPCISLNRKEIQTSYTGSAKFDVVFTFRKRHLKSDDIPLGVMEVKPPRYNADAKAASKDYFKVINALYRLLENISERIQDWAYMAEIVVVGIVCHGFTMKIIQGRHPASDYYLFKETQLDMTSVPSCDRLLHVVWQIRIILEKSHERITAALATDL
ncbi:hypothetical protein EV426DRAFT_616148 [Tirmania nivea]|nr:hypothetical protein EV426DRAFT_616148 [Tirmania nivea]